MEQLAGSAFGEGYGICDIESNVEYDDYAYFDSGNWGPASVVSHSATSVKIARTTSDGLWTLTQTISPVATTGTAKIVMMLKNNSSIAKLVRILRYADVEAGGDLSNNMGATQNSAFGWNTSRSLQPFGLVLQGGTGIFPSLGYVQNVQGGPAPCNPFLNEIPGPLLNADGSLVLDYSFSIAAHASQTMTLGYKGL